MAFSVAPTRAGAQDPSSGEATSNRAARTPPRFVVGAGLDGFLRDGSQPSPQLALHAGYEFPRSFSSFHRRFGLRLGADYTAAHRSPTEVSSGSSRSQVFGAVLLGTYALSGKLSGSTSIRPYALGGGGLYGLTLVATEPGTPPGSPITFAGGTRRVTRVSPAVSGGLGLAVPVGGVALFGEARITYMPNGSSTNNPGVRAYVVPLIVGLRF